MKKVEKLVKVFKLTGLTESEKIELDNLDWARLVYDESGEVVVENEHCTQFPLSDLSSIELDIFLANINDPIDSLGKLQDLYIDRCVSDTDFNTLDDYEQLIEEIDESLDFDDFINVISMWSHDNIDTRFIRVFGKDTKYFKKLLVVSK